MGRRLPYFGAKHLSKSIANVVDTLVAILEDTNTIGKVIMMHDGETPIKEALKQVK